jgi:hypothetical protein
MPSASRQNIHDHDEITIILTRTLQNNNNLPMMEICGYTSSQGGFLLVIQIRGQGFIHVK